MEKMISLEELIPSRAVREQCILENRVFDLREQATLVWNNPELSNRGRLELLEEIKEEAGKCCFCGSVFGGRGNSTWPIYYEMDGETHRCCDKCNEEFVVAARKDRVLIMKFREKFGISYERYEDEK